MARALHSTDYIMQPKQGLAADLNTTANVNSAVDGELAYTTDRKQLNIFNGTTFEEVNKYTTYVYNSSGTQTGSTFNDFADMQESIGGREVRVQFEQHETLPTPYSCNVDYQTWVGQGSNPDDPAAPIITFPTGFTFSSAVNWHCDNGLNIRSTSANPIYVQNVSTTHQFRRTAIGATTAPFFSITADGLHAFSSEGGFGFENDGAPIANVTTDASAYGVILVMVGNGTIPVIEDDAIASDTPIVWGTLTQSSEADSAFGNSTQSLLDAGSVNFATSGGLFSNAKVIGFLEGNPDGIPSSIINVNDALEHLATHATTVPSSASDTGVAGTVAYDSSYIYVCTATDTWQRVAVATW